MARDQMARNRARPLRVLFLSPTPWGEQRKSFVAGSGPDPEELHNQLAALGIESEVIDPNPFPWNPFAGRNSLLDSLDPSRALRVLTRERRFDVIVSVFEGSAAPLLALRHLFGLRSKIVLWDIGLTEQWRLRETILDFVVPRADGIMVLGSNQKPYIERRWQVKAPVDVILRDADTSFYYPHPSPENGPIVSIGEDAGRDFNGLLAAAQGLDAELVIKTRRQRQNVDLSGYPNVSLLSEWLSHLALRQLYARSRFVVVPLFETLNASGVSSIVEASAMGKGIVVSASDGIRDYIVPDETCLAVPCGDPKALRSAMERLIAEPETCARLGANARRYMEQNFSPAIFAGRMAQALRRAADGP